MADGDDRRIPRASTFAAVNSVFRQIVEMIYKQEGRKGPVTIRDDMRILGDLTVLGPDGSETIMAMDGNHVLGTPNHARYIKSTNTAGAGTYVWTESFNNRPDIFQLNLSGTTITVTERGYYRVFVLANAENAPGVKTLARLQFDATPNSIQQGSHGPLLPASGIFTHYLFAEGPMEIGGTISVELVTGQTRIGAGGGDNFSRLYVTRVN